MESTPTDKIAKSTGFSLKCNMQSSQWGNTRLPCCFARSSGWQQLPCAVTSFISRLSTHINIYMPQIKPDPTAVCSGKFIIKLKREEGQWQQEDTRVNTQTGSTSSAQPHSEMIQEFRGHPLLCTYCMANIQSVNQIQSQLNLHHFLQCYQQITQPIFSKFYIKINPFKVI